MLEPRDVVQVSAAGSSPARMRIARIILPALAVAYPLLVYGGLRFLPPRTLALFLGAFCLARSVLRWRQGGRPPVRQFVLPVAAVSLIVALAAIFNEGRFFLFVPVLINAAVLVTFARTLFKGPPLVESLARLEHPVLNAEEVRHCRRVTWVWCAFFLLNGGAILWLAVRGDLAQWTVYTGGVTYILMGILFAAEVTYRAWRFRRYEGGMLDPLFRRIFPPRARC